MTFAQLVELYFERSVALQNYWTLYVVVIGGLLAISSLRQFPNRPTTLLVTILFCCFAYKNCAAIVETTRQREAALTASRQQVVPIGDTELLKPVTDSMLSRTGETGVRRFHYFCDALTVITLWSMEWRRRRRAQEFAFHSGDVAPPQTR